MADTTVIHSGAPSRLAAVGVIVVAVLLVGAAAARDGLDTTSGDFVPPWAVAALTFAGAGWLAWRWLSQVVELDDDGLLIRNVSSTVHVPWHEIDSLRLRRRVSTVGYEISLPGPRRRISIGATTRFAGPEATAVGRQVEERARAVGLF